MSEQQTELELAIRGDSAHTPPSHILESLPEELAHAAAAGAPHTVYQELWHITFWQQISLEWIAGIDTAFPERPEFAFPDEEQTTREPWSELCARFFRGNAKAAEMARNVDALPTEVQCPSVPGKPPRTMTVKDQLISMAAHNAYHFGRIVLLRQMLGAWPPPSGGFTW